jgi:hypothetical protein
VSTSLAVDETGPGELRRERELRPFVFGGVGAGVGVLVPLVASSSFATAVADASASGSILALIEAMSSRL